MDEHKGKGKWHWRLNNQRVMLISIIVGIVITSLVLSLMGVNMSNNTRESADRLGDANMKSIGFQISQRFQSVMDERITDAKNILEYWNNQSEEDAKNGGLAESAVARDFMFLALYRVNEENINDRTLGREYYNLLGDELFVPDMMPFRNSVLNNEEKIAVGSATDEEGNEHDNVVIISVPTDKFTMGSGEKSMSLIAGVRNSKVVKMLNIKEAATDDAAAYIVRRNQDVIITQTIEDANDPDKGTEKDDEYFKNKPIKELFRARLKGSDVPIDTLVNDLAETMANRDPETKKAYTNIIHIGGSHIHIYANNLDHSEWCLVVLMNNRTLNGIVDELGDQWTVLIVVCVLVVFVVIAAIFVLYRYFNKKSIKELEAARMEALDASKAKSEFLSNMSHDIRTPMNAIVGMTAIARANIDNKQQVTDCLKKINISSKHLLGLINDVLDMSKIESGKMTLNMEQISLREVVDGITTIVQPQVKSKRQSFNVNVRNIEQEKVYCDGVRLNQVLINLLSNSVKFTPEEGTIEFLLEQEKSPLGDHCVRTHIRVKDNGIGMSEEFQKKIFESFSREDNQRVHRTEGTGLGMAITKYIVDAMKGTITVKSKQGEGTQFDITLDLERVMLLEEEMSLPPWKMLIVDDDEQLCETTSVALADLGVQTESSLDGEEAIEKTVAAYENNTPYDIIMLDWKLPGIDGIETAKRIRKRFGDEVPILLMSAYDSSEIEASARSVGISGFLNKPLFKSTLYYGLKGIADSVKATGTMPVAQKQEEVSLDGLHVLLAEDNELNWEIAETLLDSVGISCDHAENGQICVDMFKNSAPGTYKAILMDLRMPVMNGLDATVEIRKLDHPDKDLPIIAMTADAFTDDMKRCLDAGMNAHIAKPIDIETVQRTLKKFVKNK